MSEPRNPRAEASHHRRLGRAAAAFFLSEQAHAKDSTAGSDAVVASSKVRTVRATGTVT